FTHDSIYVGEDGPTHQPVEILASLRAIPGVQVLRPADAEETLEAWKIALSSTDHPTCLVLTRQDITGFEKDDADWKKNIVKGAYIARKGGDTPEITILATGSEVSMAIDAANIKGDKKIRVVSILDYNKFDEMSKQEQDALIGGAKRVICAEAGISANWKHFASSKEDLFCIDRFGLSGPATKVAEHLKFTAKNLAEIL
ncbi:MAG: transketolase, partial [Treponemataceae bacterium]|nr:transketolase [Treponemataceae bacterium]